MSRISSLTLFNFTDSLEYLIDNLRNGFYCNPTYEKLPVTNHGYRVPMACFCDIPLSLIKEHFDWYGRYGIGIKRTYARAHGVKPVWYVTSESLLVKNLIKNDALAPYERKYLLPYLKQHQGNQLFRDSLEKRKIFYDERKWRYIPDNSLVEPLFKQHKSTIAAAAPATPARMPLDLNEIEYIIIEHERDFEALLLVLDELSKRAGVPYERLISKVITAKQIERDF